MGGSPEHPSVAKQMAGARPPLELAEQRVVVGVQPVSDPAPIVEPKRVEVANLGFKFMQAGDSVEASDHAGASARE
jgi:hypothetical protein